MKEQRARITLTPSDGSTITILDELLLLEEGVDAEPDQCRQILATVGAPGLERAPPNIAGLLKEAASELERRANWEGEGIFLSFHAPKSLAERLRALRLALGGERYVYHGTTLGRLASILERGLEPGAPAVWKTSHLQAHVASGVFFADGLRGAQNWAMMAHRKGRGRKESRARRPVVLRIPAAGLALHVDSRAIARGCLVSPDKVDVHTAEGILAGSQGPLEWQSLTALSDIGDLPSLPGVYKLA